MGQERHQGIVIAALQSVAPEIEADEIDSKANLQDQFDLDSVDILTYVIKVSEDLGVEIPEKDYPKFLTVDGALSYLTTVT